MAQLFSRLQGDQGVSCTAHVLLWLTFVSASWPSVRINTCELLREGSIWHALALGDRSIACHNVTTQCAHSFWWHAEVIASVQTLARSPAGPFSGVSSGYRYTFT